MMNRGRDILQQYKFNFVNYLDEQEHKELDELIESFDTKYNIDEVIHTDNITYYMLEINKEKYRILIERNGDAIRIMFDVLRNGEYRANGITNKLNTKETLTLFGTILNILKQIKFNHLFIDSHEPKKFNLYKKFANKLLKDLFKEGKIHIEGTTILIYDINHKPKLDLFKSLKFNKGTNK